VVYRSLDGMNSGGAAVLCVSTALFLLNGICEGPSMRWLCLPSAKFVYTAPPLRILRLVLAFSLDDYSRSSHF